MRSWAVRGYLGRPWTPKNKKHKCFFPASAAGVLTWTVIEVLPESGISRRPDANASLELRSPAANNLESRISRRPAASSLESRISRRQLTSLAH